MKPLEEYKVCAGTLAKIVRSSGLDQTLKAIEALRQSALPTARRRGRDGTRRRSGMRGPTRRARAGLQSSAGRQRRSASELATTLTLDAAIAAPARAGLR